MGFACFDNPPWTTCVTPRVTVIAQPTDLIGETAAELLLKRMETPTRSVSHIRLQGELIERESLQRSTEACETAPPQSLRPIIEQDPYSNLALIPFQLDGQTWNSAEQYYQAAKFTDAEIIEKIRTCKTPHRCAALGQTRQYKLREDWDQVKVSVMERAIRARFDQHPELAKRLRRSSGELYDHTAADDFWGCGENMTGRILMRIREELRATAPASGG